MLEKINREVYDSVVFNLFSQYSGQLDSDCVWKNLKTFERNKSSLYARFKNELIIKSEDSISTSYYDLFLDFKRDIRKLIPEYVRTIDNRSEEKKANIFMNQIENIITYESFVSGIILDEGEYVNAYDGKKHKFKGAKVSKTFSKLMSSDMPVLQEKVRILYSKYKQQMPVVNDTKCYISIHPYDFLTLSDNSSNWTSCLSTGCNQDAGDFRGGVFELMNDSVTFVAYALKDDDDFESKGVLPYVGWNDKKWRVLVHLAEDEKGNAILFYNKQYPYSDYNKIKSLDEFIKKTLFTPEDKMSPLKKVEWQKKELLKKDTISGKAVSKIITPMQDRMFFWDGDNHYANLYVSHTETFPYEDTQALDLPYVGNRAYCLSCGAELEDKDDYCGEMLCNSCDENYEDNCIYCDACGERIDTYDDGYNTVEIDYETVYFCTDCFDEKYFVCDHCEETFSREDDTPEETVFGTIYCSECAKEKIDCDLTLLFNSELPTFCKSNTIYGLVTEELFNKEKAYERFPKIVLSPDEDVIKSISEYDKMCKISRVVFNAEPDDLLKAENYIQNLAKIYPDVSMSVEPYKKFPAYYKDSIKIPYLK